jgi:hypothetical protein
MEERQTLLPKPDGQSPKSQREEHAMKTPTNGVQSISGGSKHGKASAHGDDDDDDDDDEFRDAKSNKSSSSSPSKSSVGGKSNKTLSPTRSIATPEMEYDDFIEDDPLSYFEYDELNRLTWKERTEKLGHHHHNN